MKLRAVAVTAILAVGGLSACTDAGTDQGGGLTIVTGAYPLEYAISRVGGDLVQVHNLTRAGGDPHDLELTARQVGQIQDADLVVHLEHFQPSLDDAARTRDPEGMLEVSAAAGVGDLAADDTDGQGHDGHGHDGVGQDGHDHGPVDPHFWLDPTRLAATADAVADRLTALDPDGGDTYRANADALRADLTGLDEEYRQGLATCASRELVTAHEAFGYLAHRYDLHQVGIAGVVPDAEPSPRQMAEVVEHIRSTGVDTIYTEPRVAGDVARTVAEEAGVRTAVLDPLEGLTTEDAEADYLSVMRTNLDTLRTGQECS